MELVDGFEFNEFEDDGIVPDFDAENYNWNAFNMEMLGQIEQSDKELLACENIFKQKEKER